MTDTLTASVYVNAPVAPPRKGGLLDVATVIDRPDGIWAMGQQWDSEVCGAIGSYDSDACLVFPDGQTKDVVGIAADEALPFVTHAVVACGLLVGADRYAQHARALLDSHESNAVEDRLANRWIDDTTAQFVTTPHNIVESFAVLEGLGALYGAAPIIHLTPEWATRAAAAHLLTWDAIPGELTTMLGTRVAVGGGYRGPSQDNHGATTPAADQGWLFVTGWVTLERGPVTEAVADDVVKNTRYALAERIYIPFVDCLVGAVLADSVFP